MAPPFYKEGPTISACVYYYLLVSASFYPLAPTNRDEVERRWNRLKANQESPYLYLKQ